MSESRRLYLPQQPQKHLEDLARHVRELKISRRSTESQGKVYSSLDVTDNSVESSRLYVSEILDPAEFTHSFHDLRVSRRNYQEQHDFVKPHIKEKPFTLEKHLEGNHKEAIISGADTFTEEAKTFTDSLQQLDVSEEQTPEKKILLAEVKILCKKVHHLMETVKTLTEEKNDLTSWIGSLETQREEQLSLNETLSAEVCCLQEASNLNKKKLEELNNLRTQMQVLQCKMEKVQMLIWEKDELITIQKSQIAYNQQTIEEQCDIINGLKQSIHNLEEREMKSKDQNKKQAHSQSLVEESRGFAGNKEELVLSKPTSVQHIGDTVPVSEPENKNLLAETGNQLEDKKVPASMNLREKARTIKEQQDEEQKNSIRSETTTIEYSEQTTPVSSPWKKILLAECKNLSQGYKVLTIKDIFKADVKTVCTEKTEEQDTHEEGVNDLFKQTPLEDSGKTNSVDASENKNPLAETENQLKDKEALAGTECRKVKTKTPTNNIQEIHIELTPMEHSDENVSENLSRNNISLAESRNHSQGCDKPAIQENCKAEVNISTDNTDEQDVHEQRVNGFFKHTTLEESGKTISVTTSDNKNQLAETDNNLEDKEAPADTENTKLQTKTPTNNTQELHTEITPMEDSDENVSANLSRSISLAETRNHSQGCDEPAIQENFKAEIKISTENTDEQDVHEQRVNGFFKHTTLEESGKTISVTTSDNKNQLAETDNHLKDKEAPAGTENPKVQPKTPTNNTQELHTEVTPMEVNDENVSATSVTDNISLAESRNESHGLEILTRKDKYRAEHKTYIKNTEERDVHVNSAENLPEARPKEYCETPLGTLFETKISLEDEEASTSMENSKEKVSTPTPNTQHLDIHKEQRANEITLPKHSDENTPGTAPRNNVLLPGSRNQSQGYEVLAIKWKFRAEDNTCTENGEGREIDEQRSENIPETFKQKAKSMLGWFSKRLLKLGVCVCIGTLGGTVLAQTVSDILNSYLCEALWDYDYLFPNPYCSHGNLGLHPF